MLNRIHREMRDGISSFTLIELLVVIGILSLLIAVLLPTLSRVRRAAMEAKMKDLSPVQAMAIMMPEKNSAATQPPLPARPSAKVSVFDAEVGLTPRLSVGTAEPESIYEATFKAKIEATAPRGSDENKNLADDVRDSVIGDVEYEIPLPLPPQIISLSGLSITVDGRPSEAVLLRDGKLIWHGALARGAAAVLDLAYTVVGKGLYELPTPPGDIVDRFKINLTANGSDVRMLELSLQPTSYHSGSGKTTYTWDYPRLMLGRPIALDVLGIAPIDRLGELSWLGPLSVVLFGMLIGLVAKAYRVEHFDRWMLLLILGTFTAAYPMMYFAQEFIPLPYAMLAAGAASLLVIAWRAATIMPWRLSLGGVIVPAAIIMIITLTAAVRPHLQGLLLTAEAMAFFVLAMVLMPKYAPAEGGSTAVGLSPA